MTEADQLIVENFVKDAVALSAAKREAAVLALGLSDEETEHRIELIRQSLRPVFMGTVASVIRHFFGCRITSAADTHH